MGYRVNGFSDLRTPQITMSQSYLLYLQRKDNLTQLNYMAPVSTLGKQSIRALLLLVAPYNPYIGFSRTLIPLSAEHFDKLR